VHLCFLSWLRLWPLSEVLTQSYTPFSLGSLPLSPPAQVLRRLRGGSDNWWIDYRHIFGFEIILPDCLNSEYHSWLSELDKHHLWLFVTMTSTSDCDILGLPREAWTLLTLNKLLTPWLTCLLILIVLPPLFYICRLHLGRRRGFFPLLYVHRKKPKEILCCELTNWFCVWQNLLIRNARVRFMLLSLYPVRGTSAATNALLLACFVREKQRQDRENTAILTPKFGFVRFSFFWVCITLNITQHECRRLRSIESDSIPTGLPCGVLHW